MAEGDKTGIAAATSHRRRSLWIGAAIAIVLVVLLAWAGMSLSTHRGGQSLEAVRQEAKQKGIVATMQAFMATLPPVDEASNAATVYERAFATPFDWKAYKEDGSFVPIVSRDLAMVVSAGMDPKLKQAIADSRAMDRDPSMPLPDCFLRDTRDYLARRRSTLDLLHEAAAMPGARYHVNWMGSATLMPHLAGLRGAVRLLNVAAIVDAEEDRPADAAADIRDCIRAARSLEGQPILLGSLVEMACYSMAHANLARVIARSTPSNDDLAALQTDVEQFGEHLSARLPLEGEFAMISETCDLVLKGRIAPTVTPAMYLHVNNSLLEGVVNKYLPMWVVAPWYKADTALALRYLMYAMEKSDPPDMAFIMQSWTGKTSPGPFAGQIASRRYPLAESEARGIPNFMLQVEVTRAKARATAAALACLRFRNDTGRWPGTLEALVPKYLPGYR